jgi:kumamolisin
MRRRGFIAVVVLALAGAAVAGGLLAGSGGAPRSAASHRPGAVRALGPTDPARTIGFSLVLRLPGRARLNRDLEAISDPRSPQYRRFIGPRAFGARYGVSLAALHVAQRRLRGAGIAVTADYPQRTALEVRGRVDALRRVFGVRLEDYRDARGRRFRAPLGAATVPPSLGGVVSAVAGLDTRPIRQPAAVPVGGLKPPDVARAYDLDPLHRQGILGQGQTIAIATFAGYDKDEGAAFDQRFRIKGPAPEEVPLSQDIDQSPGAVGETNLDHDVIRSVAPRAKILIYEAPRTASFGDVFDRIAKDRRADIVTMSWGACEFLVPPAERQRDALALDVARRAGITIFNSNGDRGAYNCHNVDRKDNRLSVEWPSSSPSVVSVGGTRLFLDARGRYIGEAGWEDVLSDSGGGGGLTTVDPRPTFQRALGVQNRYSTGKRQIPDVSADADPDTGWSVNFGGSPGESGGTSAATPFWASSTLLIRQYAQRRGVGRLGYINPALYRIASTPQPFPPFHDVTRGGNRYYQATRGWDYSTGLGTPDVWNLARDLVGFLRRGGGR